MVTGKPSRRESNENWEKISKIFNSEVENPERYEVVCAPSLKKKLFKKEWISYILGFNLRTKDIILIRIDSEAKEAEEKIMIEQEEVVTGKISSKGKYTIKTPSKEFDFFVPVYTSKDEGHLPVTQNEGSEKFKEFFENELVPIKKVILEKKLNCKIYLPKMDSH